MTQKHTVLVILAVFVLLPPPVLLVLEYGAGLFVLWYWPVWLSCSLLGCAMLLPQALPDPEAALPEADWASRDVLVGALSHKAQLEVCLAHRFYHIPVEQLRDGDFPIRYIAIYQSRTLFGKKSGIWYWGEVTGCTTVARWMLPEIPSTRTDLYFRFSIRQWERLQRPIAIKEMGFVRLMTTRFLLEHSREYPQLMLQSRQEFELYEAVKVAAEVPGHPGFLLGDYRIRRKRGQLLLTKGDRQIDAIPLEQYRLEPYHTTCRIRGQLLH